MPKPILVIYLSEDFTPEKASDIMQSLKGKEISKEYYPLVISSKRTEVEIKVFYEKDFNEVKFEELKTIIQNEIKR